jgi:toluene monooxygenase system protein E
VARGGFAVNTPISAWYQRYQVSSPLSCGGRWDLFETFEDPRATTYAAYVRLQRDQEAYAARLLEPMRTRAADEALSADWIELLERALTPFRFLGHGLQMAAAYVGSMAPGGRIAVTAAMQAADEVRRVHGIAYRMAQLRVRAPRFGDGSRDGWQGGPAWQPMRAVIEQVLGTYDWGEAMVALNVCLKPVVDQLFNIRLSALAGASGDHLDAQWLLSFEDDAVWQRAWTTGLLRLLIDADAGARSAVARWTDHWSARVANAAATLTRGLDGSGAWDGEAAARAVASSTASLLSGGRDAA